MEIVANDMKLLGKRDDNSGTTNHNTDVSPIGTVPPPSVDEMPADDLPF